MSKGKSNGRNASTQPPPPDRPEEAVRELRVLFGELKLALSRSNEQTAALFATLQHNNRLTAECINALSIVELAVMGGEAKGIAHDAEIETIKADLAALKKYVPGLPTLPAAEPAE